MVLAQLLLVYQKRAHDLRMKMEPMRRRIRNHRTTMTELFTKVQERGAGRLAELERSLAAQGEKLERAEASYEELADDDMLQTPEAGEEEDDADPFDEDYDPGWEAQAAAARETARELLALHESLENRLNETGRDREVIARTLERMESQFGEEVGGTRTQRRRQEATS